MKRTFGLVLAFISFVLLASTNFAQTNNGCSLKFTGKARKLVKMRSPGRNYPKFKNGNAITVDEFLTELCPVATTKVPDPVPPKTAMIVERQTVTIRAFVLAMKLDGDNDLHIQIGDKASPFKQNQIIVEIPPTNKFCDVRTSMMDLLRAESPNAPKQHVFTNPPQVEITGYLFLDSHHGSSCSNNGNRGIKNGLSKSPVKGTWELHPIVDLVSVQ
jgi:hypothetical protein